MPNIYLLEDNSGGFVLEDGSGVLLLEDGVAWAPTDLGSALVGLFDFTNAAKVTDPGGGVVSAVVNDAGGSVTLTQTDPGAQPSWNSTVGVYFNPPGGQALSIANLPASTELHYFIVGTPEVNTNWRTALWAASNYHPLLIESGSNNVGHYSSGFSQFSGITAAGAAAALFYLDSVNGAASLGATNGNTPAATGASYGGPPNAVYLGNNSPPAGGGQGFGYIKGVGIVAGSMTTLDRQKFEGYLGWKYGLISNFPGGHPYKSAAP